MDATITIPNSAKSTKNEKGLKHFSIIIPTLNEADNIAPLLRQIEAATLPLGLIPEIVFVDDGSTDQTRQNIDSYSGELDVRLVRRDSERGLTGAVVAGAQVASHLHVVVMDADLSHPPQTIPALIEPLAAGQFDMVIGSRYISGGKIPHWPLIRRLGSKLASLPASLLTSVRDPLSGFFAVDRDRLKTFKGNMAGFKIGLEILAEKNGPQRVLEVPITFNDRHKGNSKMSSNIFKEYLRQLWRLYSEHSLARNLPLFLGLSCAGGILDYALFAFLTGMGMRLETSHMVSLLVSMHACYFASTVTAKNSATRIAGDYRRFLTLIIMGLFLRGGVLAVPAVTGTSSIYLLSVTLGLTSCLIWLAAIVGTTLGILRLQNVNWKIFGAFVIVYTILLRLVYLGSPDLMQEEAYYWNYAQHLAAGYLDHPPVVALLIKLGTLLLGQDEAGVRLGAFFCWCITAFFTYRLTKNIFNEDSAFRALVLVAALPIFFGVAVVITPDSPLIACWSGALYFLYRALVVEERRAWIGAGICLGIGLASKYTIAFLGPAVLLFMLIDPTARKWFLRPQPYLCALLAGAIFSPVIWWNYENHWASFLFQSQGRLQAGSVFSSHLLLLSILILLTPTGLLAAVIGMLPQKTAGAAAGSAHKTGRRGYIFCLVTALIPLSIFTLFSLTKEIKLNWTGPLWLALLPFMASAMIAGTGKMQLRLARLWPDTLVALLLIYGMFLHYLALGLPGVPFDLGNSVFLFGWDDLSQKVEDRVKAITAPDGRHPLIVGMDRYRTASGLAFYRSKYYHQRGLQNGPEITDVTGYHLFGYEDLMYSYWYQTKWASGRDILIFSEDKRRMDSTYFDKFCTDFGEIQEITVEKRGKDSGHLYYRLLSGYLPAIPEN